MVGGGGGIEQSPPTHHQTEKTDPKLKEGNTYSAERADDRLAAQICPDYKGVAKRLRLVLA